LLDSTPSPKKLTIQTKIHIENDLSADTRERKEFLIAKSNSVIQNIEEGMSFWPSGIYLSDLLVIKNGGRGSISQMRSTQKEILGNAVEEFLSIKYGDAAKFKRTAPSGQIISCIPNDAINQFNEWLDERIAAGKLNLSFFIHSFVYLYQEC
jgi:hypothetical protein